MSMCRVLSCVVGVGYLLWPVCSLSKTLSVFAHLHSLLQDQICLLLQVPGGSEVKASTCNAGDLGLIPGSGRSPGEGNGNPLQYSCLENPMDGGACRATVHGVAKSRTRLTDFTFTFQVFLEFLLLHSSPLSWKGHLFWLLVLRGLIGLQRTIQLQLLQHYWLGHRLGLPWYWMVCFGNEQRSFCRFWDCIQVLHFRLFCWPWCLLHFF